VEQQMWRAFREGRTYDLRTGRPGEDDPFTNPDWPAERSVRARAVAELLLDPPAPVPGRVAALKLAGVRITGCLALAGGTVTPYLQLDGCRFDEQVLLPECRAGSMRLVRCLIPRLEAARLQVTGDLHLPQCVIPGGMRLTDATIGTDLLLNQLTVRRDRHSRAIAADGLTVGQDVDAELIEVTGEFSLRSARIGGRLSLRGAHLNNPYGRYALNAARLTVEHTLYLSSGWNVRDAAGLADPGDTQPPAGVPVRHFYCEGGLRLDDSRIGNAIVIHRARFRLTGLGSDGGGGSDPGSGPELSPDTSDVDLDRPGRQVSLRRAQTPELLFLPSRAPDGPVSLAGARVVKLIDRRESWPTPGRLDLTGFVYEELASSDDFPLRARIDWLHAATPEYSPGPYERLATALRAGGEDAEAREVLLAKQRRRRESLPVAARGWGWLQDVTVGYGYRPGRAAVWMAVLWALGAGYFAAHPSPPAADSGYLPHWNPALYALDLLLPVIDLGQDNAWREAGLAQWVASVMTLLGWILATTAAAGASRLLRRTA
jgi:hypothetical protein